MPPKPNLVQEPFPEGGVKKKIAHISTSSANGQVSMSRQQTMNEPSSQEMATATNAFLSFLVGAVIAYRYDNINDKALAQHLQNQYILAKPVIKLLNGGTADSYLRQVIRDIGRGRARNKVHPGMPSNRLASNMSFGKREMMRQGRLTSFLQTRWIDGDRAKLARLALALFNPDTAKVDAKAAALDKAAPILPNRFLRSLMVQDAPDQGSHVDELKMLVKRLTERDDDTLEPEELEQLKQTDPELLKRYKKLRSNIKESWKTYIRTLVRNNDGKPISIKHAIKELETAEIDAPELYGYERLRIGEDCKLYTTANKLINAFPPPGSRIRWRRDYDPIQDNGILFWYRVPNSIVEGMKGAYTVENRQKGKVGISDKVTQAIPVLPVARPKWLRDMHSSDRGKQNLACMLELLYTYTCRIGSPRNSARIRSGAKKGVRRPTQGLSTLTVNQVTPRNEGFLIRYWGKDAVPHTHKIEPVEGDAGESRQVIAIIARNLRGKDRKDYVWTTPNGARITGAMVNAYMRRVGLPVTSHKMRHIRGSAMMQELLATSRIPKHASLKVCEAKIKALALKIGKQLGHVRGEKTTPTTAIQSYITPDIIANFFTKRGFYVPRWVPITREAQKDVGE